MNYLEYKRFDINNGKGVRCVVWFSGCSHKCKNCFNKESWKFSSGKPFDKTALDTLLKDLSMDYIEGVTFSGGDCLHPRNAIDLVEILKVIKETFPTKSVWCYTGFTLEELTNDSQKACLEYVDVLLDGRFNESLTNPKLRWVGSSNQKMYVKEFGKFIDKSEELTKWDN